jgi:Fe-S-cluster-containing dehydrogenase component
MKVLTVDPGKCVGCRLCELACSLKNSGEFNPARARVRVMGVDEFFTLPIVCFQCERPYCMEVCPSGALVKDKESGLVSVTKEKCVGCKMCTLACPFGSIVFSGEDKTAVKCELCGGNPECTQFCPTGAIEFKESDTAMIYKQRALADKLKDIYEGIQKGAK